MERVDDSTWQDLGMDEVFQKLDLTVSMPGRQFLYHRMRVLEPEDAALAEWTRQYVVLQANPAWVAKARRVQARIKGREAAWLPALIMDGLPKGPRHPWLYYLCSLAPALCVLGGFAFPQLFLGALALVTLNIVINEVQGPQMLGYFPALRAPATPSDFWNSAAIPKRSPLRPGDWRTRSMRPGPRACGPGPGGRGSGAGWPGGTGRRRRRRSPCSPRAGSPRPPPRRR